MRIRQKKPICDLANTIFVISKLRAFKNMHEGMATSVWIVTV